MPREDSRMIKNTENEMPPKQETDALPASAEEIVTPIEAGAQEQAEREFQTQRKIPLTCKKAIVSVNGEDVNEVPIGRQDHAA